MTATFPWSSELMAFDDLLLRVAMLLSLVGWEPAAESAGGGSSGGRGCKASTEDDGPPEETSKFSRQTMH